MTISRDGRRLTPEAEVLLDGPEVGPVGAFPVALEINGVTKRFGPVLACDDITFSVAPGEIRGLLGQNGAGKSTLMKIVVGVERPDGGELRVGGRPVPPGDPAASARAGVGMVHQHFSLVEALTVWQNVTLGERGPLDRGTAIARVEEIGARYGLEVNPRARVEDLSTGMRQRVEIIKCLRRDPTVIILDEPTSVLSMAESHHLFEVLRALVDDHGYSAVLISHRLEEILHATDNVTILRHGRVIATTPTCDSDAASLANAMIGREVRLETEAAAVGIASAADNPGVAGTSGSDEPVDAATAEPVVLDISGVTVHGVDGRRLLDGLDLRVRRGEILGLAGVEGNGQATLVDVLSDLVAVDRGSVAVVDPSTGCAIPLRDIGVIPADRHESGCVLDMSVTENLVLNHLSRVSRRGVLQRRLLRDHAAELVTQFDIAAAELDAPLWTLSGGNQQKIIMARELSRCPCLLVAFQPTRGLDVGAMEYMWERLRQAAAEGTAVLLISSELDEILALAGRVAVLHRGVIVGEMSRQGFDMEHLGLLMGGQVA